MEDRFKFRVPYYKKYDNMFYGFEYTDFEKGVKQYNPDIEYHSEYEQCTGLKDKNGKLIYEGDIVKYYVYDVDKFNPVLRVNYTELLMRFDLVSTDGKFQSTYLEPGFNEKLEVIGNIHER